VRRRHGQRHGQNVGRFPGNNHGCGEYSFPERGGCKYSSEKPGRARRKTCLDQYKANKSTNANGGLKWLQKGGGYYSQCVKKLKGAA